MQRFDGWSLGDSLLREALEHTRHGNQKTKCYKVAPCPGDMEWRFGISASTVWKAAN